MKPLKICIDARLYSETAGGVEQFIIGLAYGLSSLKDGDEEYYFLTYSDQDEWIKPYLSGPCQILHGSSAPKGSKWRAALKKAAPLLDKVIQKIYPFSDRWSIRGLLSDGTIESNKIDIVHFAHQLAFLTKIPSIYHPHDLQHLHFPQFFSLSKRMLRELLYRTFCHRAKLVATASTWIKTDIIQQYHLNESKVEVVPLAPAIAAYVIPNNSDLILLEKKYALPKKYIFYPSQMLPGKNHLGLFDALEILKKRNDLKINLVFSGSVSEAFRPVILERMKKAGIEDQIMMLGHVSTLDLHCLYKLAHGLVIPTKFAAGSFPIWESFLSGVPVACSNITTLRMQVGDSALLFDPDNAVEIADCLLNLWQNDSLRVILIERGLKNVSRYSWHRTAEIFRAYYRRLAARPLSNHEIGLLNATPLM